VAREENSEKSDEVLQYSHLNLAHQPIFTCRILLEKTQCLQLLEVMRGYARAAEPQRSLNRPDPDRVLLVQAEDMPVDPKCEPLQFRLNDPIFLFLQESPSDYCRWRSIQSCPRTNSPGFRDCARRVWITGSNVKSPVLRCVLCRSGSWTRRSKHWD